MIASFDGVAFPIADATSRVDDFRALIDGNAIFDLPAIRRAPVGFTAFFACVAHERFVVDRTLGVTPDPAVDVLS